MAVLALSALVACSSGGARSAEPTGGRSSTSAVEESTTTEPAVATCGPVGPGDQPEPGGEEWAVVCPDGVPLSSPAARDLTGDGTPDAVFGSKDDVGTVVAVDGVTGAVLWRAEVGQQVITVPRFGDLNGDATPDVIVGGIDERSRRDPDFGALTALDGSNGAVLWQLPTVGDAWQNMYTPQPVDDVTGDGRADWVFVSGGDQDRPAADPATRPARVGVVDAATGALVADLPAPDGQESYNSPLVARDADGDWQVLMGTGGETLPGSLWRISLADLLERRGDGFREMVAGDGSSFIAPAAGGDVDGDGDPDVVAVSTAGTVTAFDLTTGNVAWRAEPATSPGIGPGPGEAIAALQSPALGQADDDQALEVVVAMTRIDEEQLITSEVAYGDLVLASVDGATGDVEAVERFDDVDSAASPLLFAGPDGTPLVLCACVGNAEVIPGTQRNDSRWGVWSPGDGGVADLGERTTLALTPQVVTTDGSFALLLPVSTAGPNWRLLLLAAPRPLAGAEPVWGGYLGTDNSAVLS